MITNLNKLSWECHSRNSSLVRLWIPTNYWAVKFLGFKQFFWIKKRFYVLRCFGLKVCMKKVLDFRKLTF